MSGYQTMIKCRADCWIDTGAHQSNGIPKNRRGRDRGYWKVLVVRFECVCVCGGGGISFRFQRHSHCSPRYAQTAAAASNPVHIPRVRCDDSSWSWLMLACHVYIKCAYCLESKQQDVAQVLSHRFAFSCLRFSVTYSCLSRAWSSLATKPSQHCHQNA